MKVNNYTYGKLTVNAIRMFQWRFLCNWSTVKVDPYIANTYITLMCEHKLKDLFCLDKNWSQSVVKHYIPTSAISFNNFNVTFMSLNRKYINHLKT